VGQALPPANGDRIVDVTTRRRSDPGIGAPKTMKTGGRPHSHMDPHSVYILEACPQQLADGRTLALSIEHHTGGSVDVQNFSASNTFETREKAVPHCINFARQIVDGKVPRTSEGFVFPTISLAMMTGVKHP
jgi:hypothetical protein